MRFYLLVSVLFAAAIVLAGPVQQTLPESHDLDKAAQASSEVLASANSVTIGTSGPVSHDDVRDLVLSYGGEVTFSSSETCTMSVSLGGSRAGLVDALSSHPGVASMSPERRARAVLVPDDPGTVYQWGLESVEAYAAWDITLGTHEVVVGVLDTGIDWGHQDIAANIWSNDDGYHGYNFIDDSWYPMDDNINGYDDDGTWMANTYTYHGTHVAGVVGAATDNDEGIAGLAQVRLMAVKVMNESGEGTDGYVASGIRWAADNGAKVIVMSLGVDGTSLPLQNAVDYASSRGVVLVSAAGNDGESVLTYPAAFPNVIGVGAVDDTDRRASFSNYGSGLDVMAPGVGIYSTQGGGSYQYLSGTSAAAPHVAGVAALMLSINPALTPEDVGQFINETARDLSILGYDTGTGWGVVSAFGAVEAVAEPTVTITDYPEYVSLNGTYSVTWLVSGGDPGTISQTYVEWGFSPGEVAGTSGSFTGTTWAEFTVDDLPSQPTNGTIYLVAHAVVDDIPISSDEVQIPVTDEFEDNLLMQFIKDVQDFITDELGLINFLLILCVLIAIPVTVAAARSRRRRKAAEAARAQAVRMAQAQSSLSGMQPVQGTHPVPPPPPPPPRFEAYVDIVGSNVVPQVVKVVEGTKVVWVNRAWAPPPGSSIRSGTVDASGEHPDGLFQSGLLIAPGDYWSCMFHKAGEYRYYLTNVWKTGTVVVEPFREGSPPPRQGA